MRLIQKKLYGNVRKFFGGGTGPQDLRYCAVGPSNGYDYPSPTTGVREPTLDTQVLEIGEIRESSTVHGDLAVLREEPSFLGMDMVSTVHILDDSACLPDAIPPKDQDLCFPVPPTYQRFAHANGTEEEHHERAVSPSELDSSKADSFVTYSPIITHQDTPPDDAEYFC